MNDAKTDPLMPAVSLPLLAVRSGLGGTLMGLANLVPGISGGTMLLAAGVYPRFITAIGEVSTLKFRKASVVTLAGVVGAAILAIGLFSKVVKDLVVDHRWVMYSLFIGLTLGGVPVVWRLIDRRTAGVWIAAGIAFVGMAALALVQGSGGGGGTNEGFVFMFLAGVAGASAMILPGVSGGYLLLVMGVYVPILGGIAALVAGLKAMDMGAIVSAGLSVALPVGLGVVVGVVVVSNLLRWLLAKYERPTLGVLLGLLLGAVVGLWPFEEPVTVHAGDTVKGQSVVRDPEPVPGALPLIYEQTGKVVEADDLPTEPFSPSGTQWAAAIGLVLFGFGLTLGVDFIGRDRKSVEADSQAATV